MRKMLYLGGPHCDDGRTHPITRYHPHQDDKADSRPHAIVDEAYGHLRIAESPDHFRWADPQKGDADALEQAKADLAAREAAAPIERLKPTEQIKRLRAEVAERDKALAAKDVAYASLAEQVTVQGAKLEALALAIEKKAKAS